MPSRVHGGRWSLALGLAASSLALGVYGSACKGGELDAGPLCSASQPAPSGVASARIYAPLLADGGLAPANTVNTGLLLLPGGRILSPAQTTFGTLGFPINVVTHPRLPVAYVVDVDYGAFDGDPSARCAVPTYAEADASERSGEAGPDAGSAVRGIHVMSLAGPHQHEEIQSPGEIGLPQVSSFASFSGTSALCPEEDGGWRAPRDASYGIAITKNRTPAHVYLSTGLSGFVYDYVVNEPSSGAGEDASALALPGTLSPCRSLYVGGYTAGLALSADETRLWVVQFVSSTTKGASSLVEVNLGDANAGVCDSTGDGADAGDGGNAGAGADDGGLPLTGRRVDLPIQGGYAVAVSPGDGDDPQGRREVVYVSGFRRGNLYRIDPDVLSADADGGDAGDAATSYVVGRNPEGLVVSPDGKYVFVAVSDDDTVVAMSTADGTLTTHDVAADLVDDSGVVGGSSPSALALDRQTGYLYVTRAADNAVSVLDTNPAHMLEDRGAIPVGFYPTALALSDAGLVVTHGKGLLYDWAYANDAGGAGYNAKALQGDMLVTPADAIDGETLVKRNLVAPSLTDPFTCEDRYPVPLAGGASPIQHVVLIVRENKTYDFLLGGVDGDDEGAGYQIDNHRSGEGLCLPWGDGGCAALVPNIQKLAAQFASASNFYDNSEVSMVGHAWLTGSFVNDYLQRAFTEANGGSLVPFDFTDETGFPPAEPGPGTFFQALLRNDIDFVVYGEITGAFGVEGNQFVLNHIDLQYPGRVFDLTTSDIDRVNYAVDHLVGTGGYFPPFVYMELPRDHTNGTGPGVPTPASMIAENDYATGLFVEKMSQDPSWASTAIFIVEDDPQIGFDHVDYHRSICVIASPWARRIYSQTHYAYPSLFRTFELILGMPRMNRFDAYAMPMRDMFTSVYDGGTYEASPLEVPLTYNQPSSPSLDLVVSSHIDFQRADTSSLLGEVVWKSLTGEYPPGSRILELARTGRLLPYLERSAADGDGDGR